MSTAPQAAAEKLGILLLVWEQLEVLSSQEYSQLEQV